MKEIIERGATSQIVHVFIPDSASTTGGGKTGLTEASAGLKIVVMRPGEASPTKYLQSAGNIETITTIGTYQAPTAGKCRFKEIDATDLPGWYELHFDDALFNATSSRRSLGGMISGASGVVPTPFSIQLSDPVRGVGSPTALPNGVANGAGGLPISTAGGLDLDTLLANLDAAISSRAPESGGNLATLLTRIVGTLAAGTHQPQSGDAYAVVANGTHGNAALKTLIDAIDTVVDAVLADTGTDGVVVAAGSKTGYALTSGERDAIAAAMLDLTDAIETGITLRVAIRVIAAICAGKISGAGTGVETFVGLDGATDRVEVTVDNDGNRTAVTIDP